MSCQGKLKREARFIEVTFHNSFATGGKKRKKKKKNNTSVIYPGNPASLPRLFHPKQGGRNLRQWVPPRALNAPRVVHGGRGAVRGRRDSAPLTGDASRAINHRRHQIKVPLWETLADGIISCSPGSASRPGRRAAVAITRA